MPQLNSQPGTQTAGRPPFAGAAKRGRVLNFAVAVAALLWFVLSDALAGKAARGITERLDVEAARPLLASVFLIFLLVIGYSVLEAITGSERLSVRGALALPQRPTAGREWALGAALGWGMAVAAVLPMALARTLHVSFWMGQRAFGLLALSFLTLLCSALALEVALRGYGFTRLIAAMGPARAVIAMAIVLGVAHGFAPEASWISVAVTVLGSILLSLAWLRTHGLWLPWGLHFAWNAGLAAIFGLPIRGDSGFSSMVETRAMGAAWLTGGGFGPEGALLTALVVLIAIAVLVRTTGDYAWEYTRPEIVAAGYEVNPPPPAAHVAMEEEVGARPPALVQILPSTSHSPTVDGR